MKNSFFKGKLFCFTPEVALATFVLEALLAVYVFIKLRTSQIGRIVIATLILLATFQLSEYLICSGHDNHFWQVVGGTAITFLPALGLHLISVVTGRKFLVRTYYFLGIIFAGMMIFVPGVISTASCAGNYIIFRSLTDGLKSLYKFYYLSGMVLTVLEALYDLRIFKHSPLKRRLLWEIIIGHLSFMIPASFVILIPSFGLDSLPSVLCGFAIILALILAFFVVPTAKKLKI
ncbi:MAG: hypothetical protein UT05_C0001G0024 [Parcubacteria group bacterium GW2011_GWF2_38_76]|nr:MAG: hypothetical protein UT05_C0001G0024 [Parcubacteria group bacterium GW2011_GWF2_38_76]HBM45999.1 hypothetical protein [Patescibacteria group bacterium]